MSFLSFFLSHLRQNIRKAKDALRKKRVPKQCPWGTIATNSTILVPFFSECGVCPGGATQNLPPGLWAFSGTGSGTPPGHTQILRPRNLWHISSFQLETDCSRVQWRGVGCSKNTVCVKRNAHLIPNCFEAPLGERGQKFTLLCELCLVLIGLQSFYLSHGTTLSICFEVKL